MRTKTEGNTRKGRMVSHDPYTIEITHSELCQTTMFTFTHELLLIKNQRLELFSDWHPPNARVSQ